MLDMSKLAQVNDPLIVRDMIRSGGGLSFAPDLYCRAGLADGSLVQLYPEVRIKQESSLSLLYPGRRLLPKKTRVFIDFLTRFAAISDALEDEPNKAGIRNQISILC